MGKINNITWQPTCCAWHGEYAEVSTADGGVARIKRSPDVDGYLVMRFDSDNRAIDVDGDGDGVPDYVAMNESEAEALLS